MAIRRIAQGDVVECLKCRQRINIDETTFILTPINEIIVCHECGFAADVQRYHLHGRKFKIKKSPEGT